MSTTNAAPFFHNAGEARNMSTTLDRAESELLPDVDTTLDFFPELTLKDRCDSCGAAAQAQFSVDPELPHVLVCGHHWHAVVDNVVALGYRYQPPAGEHDRPFTWARHKEPWENQFRDAGRAKLEAPKRAGGEV